MRLNHRPPARSPARLAGRLLILGCSALALLATGARAEEGHGNFDPPLEVRGVDLGPAATEPMQHKEVRCTYFPHFMVKEVDELEVGASQLSIIASAPGMVPPCQRANIPGEHVIEEKTWAGYFSGAKGEYAVFSAADGENGGLAFAVFQADTAALRFDSVSKGSLRFTVTGPASMSLRYLKLYSAKCSVIEKGEACTQEIGTATRSPPPPAALCRTGYAEQKRVAAHAFCEAHNRNTQRCIDEETKKMASWDSSPSVVAIPFEVVLRPDAVTERPVGPPEACGPAD